MSYAAVRASWAMASRRCSRPSEAVDGARRRANPAPARSNLRTGAVPIRKARSIACKRANTWLGPSALEQFFLMDLDEVVVVVPSQEDEPFPLEPLPQ